MEITRLFFDLNVLVPRAVLAHFAAGEQKDPEPKKE
jgi:hypothetical protein